jgi:hypothetical protein
MTSLADSARPAPAGGRALDGRVAFVTGGTRGIGAAICHSLAADGAAVAAGYSRNEQNALAFAESLSERGVPASVHQGNVGSAEDCRRAVQEVVDRHGRLDILVNNAGILIDRTVAQMTDEDWYRGDGQAARRDPDAAAGNADGYRPGRALPVRRPVLLHHRPDLVGEWRNGHVDHSATRR